MEVIVGDFDLEWERKDGVVHKADYDDLIKAYEKQEEHDKEVRNKAIDEFTKMEDYLMDKIKEEIVDVNIDFEWRKVVCLDDIGTKLREGLREIAEQMREVENNE